MTAGSIGMLIFDEYVFPQVFDVYAPDSTDNLTGKLSYGKWNQVLFATTAGVAVFGAILASIGSWFTSLGLKSESGVFSSVKF